MIDRRLYRSIRHRLTQWRLVRREVRHPAVRACLVLAVAESGISIERIQFLARGGNSLVFRALCVQSDDIAIKVPRYSGRRPDEIAAAEFTLRREGEGDVLAAANLPCVPRLLWRPRNGCLLVRELVEGSSVDAIVKQYKIPAHERLQLVIALLDLARALFAGVHTSVHGNFVVRDLKPRNLVREAASGRLKQIDLGAVRREGEDAATKDDVMRLGTGKWLFWAPEQLCRDPVVDRRADYFALGATAFYILTTESPYANRCDDALGAIQNYQRSYREVVRRLRQATAAVGVHASTHAFLAACLNPSLEDRPSSMERCDG
jgi:serine/threonine protein kinase